MQDIDKEMFITELPIAKQEIEYHVLYKADQWLSAAVSELEKEVNHYLQQGWQLQGGISLTAVEGSHLRYRVCQAMYRVQNSGGI